MLKVPCWANFFSTTHSSRALGNTLWSVGKSFEEVSFDFYHSRVKLCGIEHSVKIYNHKKFITYDCVVNSLVLETLRSSNFVISQIKRTKFFFL